MGEDNIPRVLRTCVQLIEKRGNPIGQDLLSLFMLSMFLGTWYNLYRLYIYLSSGMNVEGIFRRSPATATIRAWKEQFNEGTY